MAQTRNTVRPQPFQRADLPSWEELRRRLSTPIKLSHPIEIHAIRHGETVTNAQGLVTGSQDVALTERGRQQAREVGRHLESYYDAAFCSALRRSRDTLDLALREGHVCAETMFWDPRLNERCLGELELKPARPLPAYEDGDLSFAPPGGDRYLDVVQRTLSFLLDLVQWTSEREASKVLLSAHMGSLRILAGIMEDQADPVAVLGQSFDNAELLRWTWRQLALPRFLRVQ